LKIKYEKEDFLDESAVIYGKVIEEKPVPLKRLNPQSDYAVVHGEVFDMDTYETKGGKIILTFYITDLTNSHMCKIFMGKKRYEALKDKFKNGGLQLSADMAEYIVQSGQKDKFAQYQRNKELLNKERGR